MVVWGQSPAKNRTQPRKKTKSRCPGKAMQKRVFTVWNEFSLGWLCVARLTRLLLYSTYGAVCLNFISKLFWFLKATFCCNFYDIILQNLAKEYEQPSVIYFIYSFKM